MAKVNFPQITLNLNQEGNQSQKIGLSKTEILSTNSVHMLKLLSIKKFPLAINPENYEQFLWTINDENMNVMITGKTNLLDIKKACQKEELVINITDSNVMLKLMNKYLDMKSEKLSFVALDDPKLNLLEGLCVDSYIAYGNSDNHTSSVMHGSTIKLKNISKAGGQVPIEKSQFGKMITGQSFVDSEIYTINDSSSINQCSRKQVDDTYKRLKDGPSNLKIINTHEFNKFVGASNDLFELESGFKIDKDLINNSIIKNKDIPNDQK